MIKASLGIEPLMALLHMREKKLIILVFYKYSKYQYCQKKPTKNVSLISSFVLCNNSWNVSEHGTMT